MHCPSCGTEAAAGTALCSTCGAALPHACDACGTPNPARANFCSRCGKRLASPSDPPAPVPYETAPIVMRERGPQAPGALESERRQITVLFADIRGSFGVIGRGDPEDAQALLDAVLSTMIAAVRRYEGTVNQVLGDGIMALFGAPHAHEDHAVRAARAALAMQQSVARMHDPSWEHRGVSPQIRVGLDSGEVLLQSLRTDLGSEYRAIGTTTHMAARMEQLAAPGRVWLTASTVNLGRGLLRVRPLGAVEVKGLPEPVEVFELTGVMVRTRFEAADSRDLTALSGRAPALGALQGALRDALQGRPRAAIVSGEPGVGKSRLCFELLRTEAAYGCRVLEAWALSYGRTTPHGVLAQLLRSLLRVEDSDGPQQIADKALELARSCSGPPEPRVAVALELLGAPSGDREFARLDPVQRRRRIEDTLRELIGAWCARGPCVLLLEDLHWCDPESLAFIRGLVESPPGGHVLLLVTHRDELDASWPAQPHVLAQRLLSLDLQAAESMLCTLLGSDPARAGLRRMLAERTGGNPFFIEESARSLLEHSASALAEAQMRAVEQFDVPATIEALIAARIHRLPQDELAVLQAAAVIGAEASKELLLYVTELAEPALEQRLDALVRAELMYATGDVRTPLYRLKHALVQDVAYRQLLRPRRRALHARVVAAHETLYAARIAEHVSNLAEHSTRAELWDKAALYHMHACARATSRWANAQAMAHIERGLHAVDRLPAGPARDKAAVDLRLLALAALVPQGDVERMIALLREAEIHANALGDEFRLATIRCQLATGLWMSGRHDQAMQAAEQAHHIGEHLGDAMLRVVARYNMAMIHHARGELAASLAILRELIELFSGEQARQRSAHWSGYPAVFVRTFAVSTGALIGAFAEAERWYAEGREVADEFDHPHSRTMILEEHAFCLLVRGEPQAAREVLEVAMAVCERDEVRAMHAPIAARLGVALVECGLVERGLAVLEDALARETYRQAAHYGLDYLMTGLARARLCAGDLDGALAAGRRAVEITAEVGEWAYHVCALVELGAVLAARPDGRDEAALVHDRALAHAERLGMRPWQALALQGRAELRRARGLLDAAREDLDAAAAIWRELGAGARLAQVAALQSAGSPAVLSGAVG